MAYFKQSSWSTSNNHGPLQTIIMVCLSTYKNHGPLENVTKRKDINDFQILKFHFFRINCQTEVSQSFLYNSLKTNISKSRRK